MSKLDGAGKVLYELIAASADAATPDAVASLLMTVTGTEIENGHFVSDPDLRKEARVVVYRWLRDMGYMPPSPAANLLT